ncbi:MAG: DUF6089 family protein [Saprospiraceae bacterium]|nr:DUF6089 family protein [Saprospiraceae bacterium]
MYILIRFICLFLCLHLGSIQAQFAELGIFGGVLSYHGELSHQSLLVHSKPCYGFFLRYNTHPYLATRIRFLHGSLVGKDKLAKTPEDRLRNLSFQSRLTELALIEEFNLIPFYPKDKSKLTNLYISIGIGFFLFDPKTEYAGQLIRLQPLGTEGQGLNLYKDRTPYKLYQLSVPLGFGMKYSLNKRANLGLDISYQFTFTDYIDDVSTTYVPPRDLESNGEMAVRLSNRTEEYTGLDASYLNGERRGNSNNKDAYWSWTLCFSYNLYKKVPYSSKKDKAKNRKLKAWF